MKPRAFLLPNEPPVSWQLEHLFTQPAFVRDARALLGVSEDALEEIRNRCEVVPFANHTVIEAAVNELIEEDEQRAAVINVLVNLPDVFLEQDRSAEWFEKMLSRALRKALTKDTSFQPADIDQLARLLSRLSVPPAGLSRQQKAERLVDSVGSGVRTFELITDVRPVFNDERTVIQGYVLVTTAVIGTDDLAAPEVTLHLTEGDLSRISKKIEDAQNKLKAARAQLEEKGFAIAEILGARE